MEEIFPSPPILISNSTKDIFKMKNFARCIQHTCRWILNLLPYCDKVPPLYPVHNFEPTIMLKKISVMKGANEAGIMVELLSSVKWLR